jgi:hypothetical protein
MKITIEIESHKVYSQHQIWKVSRLCYKWCEGIEVNPNKIKSI